MSLPVTQLPSQREPKTYIESLSGSPRLYSSDADTCDQPKPDTTRTPTMTSTPPQITADGAPALPMKSSLRASRLLDDVVLTKMAVEGHQPLSAQTAPHDVYLSSEEDASSSAADFSDFELDSDIDEPQQSSDRRGSHEDTARLVSVVFAGKPSVIDLPRRSSSPSCASDTSSRPSSRVSSQPPTSRLRRTSTLPVENRASICSSSSAPLPHPPRTSSMGPGRLEKIKPQFLSIDPFAVNAEAEAREKEEEQNDTPKTPKTPTGVFKRTLSLVRKRSRPSLNTSYATQSRDNLSLFTPTHPMEQVQEDSPLEPLPRAPAASTPVLTKAPTYHEIMKNAKRRTSTAPLTPVSPMSEPPSPMTTNSTRTRLRQGLAAAARRRSSIRT